MSRTRTDEHSNRGFTLIELVLVVVITGVLATTAIRTVISINQTARIEQTKQELEQLHYAIAGNPDLHNNGLRSDFGYVGDVGALPPDLTALVQNPGGYATWNGPYVRNQVSQTTDDYKRDAWDTEYAYTGLEVISTGSGSDIVRRIGNSAAELTLNQVSGLILDTLGMTPGTAWADSLQVRLLYPDGSGGTTVRSTGPDPGGYFDLDSIPIGNHELQVLFIPTADTMRRVISVLPGSQTHARHVVPQDFTS